MIRRRRRNKPKAVSATELAQMGICERRVVFERRHGKRINVLHRTALSRGSIEHRQFYVDGIRLSEKPARCYASELGTWLRIGVGAIWRAVARLIDLATRGVRNNVR